MPTVDTMPDHKVYMRSSWAVPWTGMPAARALRAERAAAPKIGTADLFVDYGMISRAGATFVGETEPDLAGMYVRIDLVGKGEGGADLPIWYGVALQQSDAVHDDALVDAAYYPTGDATLKCAELSILLDRHVVGRSRCRLLPGETIGWIDRALTVNAPRGPGLGPAGNRSKLTEVVNGTTGEEAYTFAPAAGAELWRNSDYLQYLAVHETPGEIRFGVAGDGLANLDRFAPPVIEPSQRTTWSLIGSIVDRRRGHIAQLTVTENSQGTNETVFIEVVATFDEEVTAAGVTMEPNTDAATIDLRGDHAVRSCVLGRDESKRYDEIQVRGAPLRTVFTVSVESHALERAWTDIDEEDYAEADEEQRRSEAYRHVYTTFVLSESLDWMLNGKIAAPRFDAEARLETDAKKAHPQRNWGMRLLATTPIRYNWRVEGGDGPLAELIEPFAYLTDPLRGRPVLLEHMARERAGYEHVGLRLLNTGAGVRIISPYNHLLALGHIDAAGLALPPIADYTTLRCTLAAELDHRPTVELTGLGGRGTLIIDVNDAEFWYITPKTVVDVVDGSAGEDSGGLARDDGPRLRSIAALARAWYGSPRRALALTVARLHHDQPIGKLIEKVQTGDPTTPTERTVGTVVSSVAWDFADGTTTIKTDFAAPDAAAFVPPSPTR